MLDRLEKTIGERAIISSNSRVFRTLDTAGNRTLGSRRTRNRNDIRTADAKLPVWMELQKTRQPTSE